MRSSALFYAFVMFMILEIAIICSITSNSAYTDDIRQSLEESVELSINMLQEGQAMVIEENVSSSSLYKDVTWQNWETDDSDLTAFKKEFIECLVQNIDAKVTDVEVEIYGADDKNGLLSVEVTAYFKYLSGQVGSVSCYRTMILNRTVK